MRYAPRLVQRKVVCFTYSMCALARPKRFKRDHTIDQTPSHPLAYMHTPQAQWNNRPPPRANSDLTLFPLTDMGINHYSLLQHGQQHHIHSRLTTNMSQAIRPKGLFSVLIPFITLWGFAFCRMLPTRFPQVQEAGFAGENNLVPDNSENSIPKLFFFLAYFAMYSWPFFL